MPAMGVDAWSAWVGSAPGHPPGTPSVPRGPADLDDLYDLIVTRAARLVGTGDALLWLADDDGHGWWCAVGSAASPPPSAGAWARGKGWPARSGRPARRWP